MGRIFGRISVVNSYTSGLPDEAGKYGFSEKLSDNESFKFSVLSWKNSEFRAKDEKAAKGATGKWSKTLFFIN